MSDAAKEYKPGQGRGRGTVRGKKTAAEQLASAMPPSRPGPPPQPAQPAPVVPKPRGRGTSVPSSSHARPRNPVEEIAAGLKAAGLSEAGSDEIARGAAERTRGTFRQRNQDVILRPPMTTSKQGKHGIPINLKANFFNFTSISDWALYQYRVDFEPNEDRTIVRNGKHGIPISLKANFFNFASISDWALYQYRVDFEPDEDRTIVRKAYLKPHKDMLGPYLFDGTVLLTIKQILPDPTEVFTKRLSDDEPIRITIKKTSDCVVGDYNYLQVLNIIIRKTLATLNLQLVGRDYYDPQSKVIIKEHNLEVWPGYLTSIRQHEKEILMNVDVSSKVMRNETALRLLQECRERSSSNWKEVFESALVGSVVITRYNNATYRVDDIDFDSNPLSTFDMKGKQVSFRDYYKEKYNLNIKVVDQPLLVSRPKAKDIRGGRSNNVILVPELSCLTGITDSMRSNFQLMKALADHTRIRPTGRIERLERGFMGRIYSTPAAVEELKLWNVKFNPQLIQFPGRTLPPEVISHGDNRTSEANMEADFTRNLMNKSMLDCGNLDRWVCIYPYRVARDIQMFCNTLSKSAGSLRFRIPAPECEEIPDDRSGTYVEAIERAINRYNPTLVMCILMTNKADRYEAIKKKCYVDRALPSQVVLAKNLNSKGVMSICTKIAIQINCKIGGSPWTCPVPFKQPVMVVGFDVTHDTRQKGRSVGALVASLNLQFSRYFSAVSMHVNGEELSNDIAVQMLKAVTKFRSINNAVPSKIIFYRDGVGDGNIHHVLNHEVELIKKSLAEFYPDGGVKLTVVIVSKKINARIFSKNENPPPGTIADDVITYPERYDFFLVSQSVKQGTVSPTYYNVIYDSVCLDPNVLQRLTYKMTHLYYNWTGSIRVPAPCQYAHKLAFLVGQSIHRAPNPSLEDLLYFL